MTDAPPLLFEVSIEPKSQANWQKFSAALAQLAAEDLSLHVEADLNTGGAILRGTSESHLGSAIDRLTRIGLVKVNIRAPQVVYFERLNKKVEIDYTHKKQTGGARQFARVIITFEPNEPGAGNSFESKIVGGSLPKEYIRGVEEGFNSVMGSGILAGFPVVDLKATLIDAASRDVDSSVLAFELASRAATREALQKGDSVLLEPIMKVEVVTPEEYTHSVIGDLNSRRGQIQGQHMRGNAVVVDATAPLGNMFGYVNQLRSFTQGRANHTMQFSHYAPLPPPDDDKPFRPAMAMRAK